MLVECEIWNLRWELRTCNFRLLMWLSCNAKPNCKWNAFIIVFGPNVNMRWFALVNHNTDSIKIVLVKKTKKKEWLFKSTFMFLCSNYLSCPVWLDFMFSVLFHHCIHVCCHHGPLTRYAILQVAHAPGMPGTFSPSPRVCDPNMHHVTCMTHVPWCMPGSLTSGFLWSRWQGKRSRHSRRMRNPQFYVSGKRPMGHRKFRSGEMCWMAFPDLDPKS